MRGRDERRIKKGEDINGNEREGRDGMGEVPDVIAAAAAATSRQGIKHTNPTSSSSSSFTP
jgi:hypothetical protein